MELIRKILRPPLWLTLLLCACSTFGLLFVFLNGYSTHPLAYAVYVIAFYTLTVLCYFFVTEGKSFCRKIKRVITGFEYGRRYTEDAAFRMKLSLHVSLLINFAYAFFHFLLGWRASSFWFYIFAGYYMILAVMRFLLVRYVGKKQIGECIDAEWKRARVCAAVLTLLNLVLTGAILMMMYEERGFSYGGILIYAVAAYTFYITALAIVHAVKYRKYRSPVMSMANIITLAAALVSMLSLESAMLSAFGTEMSLTEKRVMLAVTGAGISIIILLLSCYMIVRATGALSKTKRNDNQ